MTTMKQVRERVEAQLLQSCVVSAWLGYGDPLFLTFSKGDPASGDEPDDSLSRCTLESNFATWAVEGPLAGNSELDSRDHLVVAAQALIGAVVHEVEVTRKAVLSIRFDGARILTITPWPEENEPSDAWCMSLPEGKILAVSNARKVVTVEKHVPIRDWFKHES